MLPKTYDPKATEDRIYRMWEESGAFRADRDSKKESFTISMPPPNATGNLHLGHAVMLALEDIFIRFARMWGREVLWVPGTDHAAIATENVVIRTLKGQGMKDPRKQLGRSGLVAKIAAYVEESRGTIRAQIRKMGSSCDWSRERYTMDPALNRCVNAVFKRMHDDGLMYRGHRIVNWDPHLQTTVSDDEVDWVEETAPFYTFQYGPFQISTARPETKFGDKYVVVHPDDERYKDYAHGQTFDCEWINGPIRATVIKDAAVDPSFGTGCMTITPWHDAADFDIAERHGLEKEQIIGFDSRLLPIAGEFRGQTIVEARPKIVARLKEKGLLVKTDAAYVHRKAMSQRGCGTIEPQIKLQWFIDVHRPAVVWKGKRMSLKEVMHDVVHHRDIAIIPDRFTKVYFHWIDNLRDWCVSRQIWWGHRVPVYYCSKCEDDQGGQARMKNQESGIRNTNASLNSEFLIPNSDRLSGRLIVSVFPIIRCTCCGGPVEQDPDTLDTWFSSALWTWSTLVDPTIAENPALTLEQILAKSPDYQRFHPTTVMETGYDILFFWVARMILMTTYAVGQIPFKTVYLHGLIRTREGKKMSKSDPGTMIDPLDMIGKYGADALRLSMIVGQSPGADAKLYEEKIAGYRNFVNKLWNASRFVLLMCEQEGIDPHSVSTLRGSQVVMVRCEAAGVAEPRTITPLAPQGDNSFSLADRALLHALQTLIRDITEGFEKYRLSDVGERLYSFVWDFFCDWYLELSKGSANTTVLLHTLRILLRLLHPYCPFVTEELWSQVKPEGAGMLLKETWPSPDARLEDQQAWTQLQVVIDVITAVRRIRAEQGIDTGKAIAVFLCSTKHGGLLEEYRDSLMRIAKVESLVMEENPVKHERVASAFLPDLEVHVSLEGLMDLTTMRKERETLIAYVASLDQKLANQAFIMKAPSSIVEGMRATLAAKKQQLAKIEEQLSALS